MTNTLPYLPTELTNKIFDYKEAFEAKDKHKALTEELISELGWDLDYITRISQQEYPHPRLGDERLNINSYTACRRCHNITAYTLDNEFDDIDLDEEPDLKKVKGPNWSALDCEGCLTPAEEEADKLMWRAIRGVAGTEDHPFFCRIDGLY